MGDRVDIGRERQDGIDTTAAEWVARLGGSPLSEAEDGDLALWLDADPAHQAAFVEARSAWEQIGALRAGTGSCGDGVVELPRPAKGAASDLGRRHRWAPIAAAAACLAILIVGGATWLGDPWPMIAADYRTQPGVQRTVTLSDGSQIALGPDSAVAIHYSDTVRRIDLLAGIAYFKVAPSGDRERRPFVVDAAGGTARALGTEFMVERLGADARVTVAEHRVAVALSTVTGRPPEVNLDRGQSVRYSESELGPPREVDLARAVAWQRGRLIFDDVPLSDVVVALNRYGRSRIVIVDPDLAARKVSGIFVTDRADAALATIARDLRIRTATLPSLVTLLY